MHREHALGTLACAERFSVNWHWFLYTLTEQSTHTERVWVWRYWCWAKINVQVQVRDARTQWWESGGREGMKESVLVCVCEYPLYIQLTFLVDLQGKFEGVRFDWIMAIIPVFNNLTHTNYQIASGEMQGATGRRGELIMCVWVETDTSLIMVQTIDVVHMLVNFYYLNLEAAENIS